MSDEENATLKDRIALLEARLQTQQALLEAEVHKRQSVEAQLAELFSEQTPSKG